jgi:hypothetical protein
MECAARIAEINNDRQTAAQERAAYEAEHYKWKLYVKMLLQGLEIRENGRVYTLAERLANEYEEFSAFVDIDYDFIAAYNRGEFCSGVNNLIKSEAHILADIIVEDL